MKQFLKKSLLVWCAVAVAFPAAQPALIFSPSRPSHLAPASFPAASHVPALDFILRQIEEKILGKEITWELLQEVQREILSKIQSNPWDLAFEWIWHSPQPAFEFVLGNTLYTVQYSKGATGWEKKITSFDLNQYLRSTRDPLLKTVAAEQAGVPQRVELSAYRLPDFQEEQNRLLAIPTEELHTKMLAFSKLIRELKQRGKWGFYKQKYHYFVKDIQALLKVFADAQFQKTPLRERAREGLEAALTMLKKEENDEKGKIKPLIFYAALAALCKARNSIEQEWTALKNVRVEDIALLKRWEDSWNQEQINTEALIRMGSFLVKEQPVITRAGHWVSGTNVLDGGADLVKTQVPHHYASTQDYLRSLIATVGSIRDQQELFKIYVRKIEGLQRVMRLCWEEEELAKVETTAGLLTGSRGDVTKDQAYAFLLWLEALEEQGEERLNPKELAALRNVLNRPVHLGGTFLSSMLQRLIEERKFAEILPDRLAGVGERKKELALELRNVFKFLMFEFIKEASLRARSYQEKKTRHENRLLRLREEKKFAVTLRPREKIDEQIEESEAAVRSADEKMKVWQAQIDDKIKLSEAEAREADQAIAEERQSMVEARKLIQFLESEKVVQASFRQLLPPIGLYFKQFADALKTRRAENRRRARNDLIKALVAAFPEQATPDLLPYVFDQETALRLIERIKTEGVDPKIIQSARSALKNKKWDKVLAQLPYPRKKKKEAPANPLTAPLFPVVIEPQYEDAERNLRAAREAFIQTMYEQRDQIQTNLEKLREEKEKFFQGMIQGMKIKGLLRQAEEMMAEPVPDLRTLLSAFQEMEKILNPGAEEDSPSHLLPFILKFLDHVAVLDLLFSVQSVFPSQLPAELTADALKEIRRVNGEFQAGMKRFGEKNSIAARELLGLISLYLVKAGDFLGEEGTKIPFPAALQQEHWKVAMKLEELKALLDPTLTRRKTGEEEGMPVKETRYWKAMEESLRAIQSQLDVAEEQPAAASPLLKQVYPDRPKKDLGLFPVSIYEHKRTKEKRVRVTVEKTVSLSAGPLFSGVPAPAVDLTREFQTKLEGALQKIVLAEKDEEGSNEKGLKRVAVLKSVRVFQGLPKMAAFDDKEGKEVWLDEDLFGNPERGIPFNEGLLILELQLKLDHLKAREERERSGVPASPQRLALEKLFLLGVYVSRFLQQPPDDQDAQIALLDQHKFELDKGGFGDVLRRAKTLCRESAHDSLNQVLHLITEEELIPYVQKNYPDLLKEGMALMEKERQSIAKELWEPSVLMRWNDPEKGGETLRLGPATRDDVEQFYAGRPELGKGWLSVLPDDSPNPAYFLCKVADRSGKILAWAHVDLFENPTEIFQGEFVSRRVCRLVIKNFDVASGEKYRGYPALLLFVSRLAHKMKVSPFVMAHVPSDQTPLENVLSSQFLKELPAGSSGMETHLDEEEELTGEPRDSRDQFFDAEKLYLQYAHQIEEPEEAPAFYQMARQALEEAEKGRHYRGWFYQDSVRGWHFQFNGVPPSPAAESYSIVNLSRQGIDQRKQDFFGFFAGKEIKRTMILADEKIWIVEKGPAGAAQLPLMEEQRVKEKLEGLGGALKLKGSFDREDLKKAPVSVGGHFLENTVARLEEARTKELKNQDAIYFTLLSWLTGCRIRVIDTQVSPEWLEREVLPDFGERLSTGMKLPYQLDLLEALENEIKNQVTKKEREVRQFGGDTAATLENLLKAVNKHKNKKRSRQIGAIVAEIERNLQPSIDWCKKLSPRFKSLPLALRNVKACLADLGELSPEEETALKRVNGDIQELASSRDQLVAADPEIAKLSKQIQAQIGEIKKVLNPPVVSSPIPLQPPHPFDIAI